MSFTSLDAAGYRALDTEAYQERRALVLDIASGATSEDIDEATIRSVDAELDIIKTEDARRDKLVELRNHKAAQVIMGAGNPIGGQADPEPIEKRDMSLGGRVARMATEKGFTQGGQPFKLSNIAFRASSDTNLLPGFQDPGATDYGKDTLIDVDTDIREGYRQPLTIEALFRSEVTEKDAVSFYVEGEVEGSPAMTKEAEKYSQLHFKVPEKKTNSIKKLTAFWKNSDEILSDSPRLVSHINARADYMMGIVKEAQILSGDGKGNNITGLLATEGIKEEKFASISLDLIDALLDYRTTIAKSTPNFLVDALLCSDEDYAAIMRLKNADNQYLLGGPTNMIYGNGVSVSPTLWNTIRIVPSPAMKAGTLVLGAFKAGGCVINHVTGRRFDMDYDGEDFTNGLVTFRTSERFTLAVEYPSAFVKLVGATSSSSSSTE